MWISEWLSDRKREREEQRRKIVSEEAQEEYNVTERNGSLYLVAGTFAVREIDDSFTVKQVLDILRKAREAHVSFKLS